MKKITLKGISVLLSERELKNVIAGSGSCAGRNSSCSGGTCYSSNGQPSRCFHVTSINCTCVPIS